MTVARAMCPRAMSACRRGRRLAIFFVVLLAGMTLATLARAHAGPHPSLPPSVAAVAINAIVHGAGGHAHDCPMQAACAGAACFARCLDHCLGAGALATAGVTPVPSGVARPNVCTAGDLSGRDPPPEPRPPVRRAGARPA